MAAVKLELDFDGAGALQLVETIRLTHAVQALSLVVSTRGANFTCHDLVSVLRHLQFF
jgi:hypothetical protein